MNINEVKHFCNSLQGVEEIEKAQPKNYLSYTLLGKKFAYFKTSEPESWRFSFRVSSERFLELTDQPGIKPARYMARFHWVTLVDVEAMQEDYLQELILWSYQKALSRLPKKIQAELNE
ncbi:MAG: MmcQ/YjbR family DNA-binding protein [Proteobacteria bacterium]|nr:MmcQ/YjbR family DNA-binding protein [Pseudomonadota bacterium]